MDDDKESVIATAKDKIPDTAEDAKGVAGRALGGAVAGALIGALGGAASGLTKKSGRPGQRRRRRHLPPSGKRRLGVRPPLRLEQRRERSRLRRRRPKLQGALGALQLLRGEPRLRREDAQQHAARDNS